MRQALDDLRAHEAELLSKQAEEALKIGEAASIVDETKPNGLKRWLRIKR